jgi:hypothetical protein
MSSSSSIAAARRRRAGGAPVGTPTNPTTQQSSYSSPQSQTPPGNNTPLNPLAILQQHHIKIKFLETTINEMKAQHNGMVGINNTSFGNNSVSDKSNISDNKQINANEFSDMIISRIESQLDLKAFYDNDTRLANEIESLHKLVDSQQIALNELNTTLFYMIQRLDIGLPISNSDDLLSTQNVSFDISNNQLYGGMEDDESLSNYEDDLHNLDNSMNVLPSE